MHFLLDTHVLLWWLDHSPELKDKWTCIIQDRRNTCFVSAATIWEIGIKCRLGKLTIADEYIDVIRAQGFLELPVSWAHARAVKDLPDYHRDPFDRILVAQAKAESLVLLSHDSVLEKYGIAVV
jgi:PIN domain nuclease of toxin-antitoxin system